MRKSRRCWLGDLANVPHGRRRRERAAGLPRAAREPDNERSHLTTVRLYDCTAVRAVPLPPFRTVSVKGLRNGTTRLYVYAIANRRGRRFRKGFIRLRHRYRRGRRGPQRGGERGGGGEHGTGVDCHGGEAIDRVVYLPSAGDCDGGAGFDIVVHDDVTVTVRVWRCVWRCVCGGGGER